MERYIYLRYIQKQLKITKYVRNKGFLEFYLAYNGFCLKLLGVMRQFRPNTKFGQETDSDQKQIRPKILITSN